MRFKSLLALLLVSSAATAEVRIENCKPESAGDQFLYNQDFKWGYTLPEMISRFTEIYQSEKRLKKRAYFDIKTQKLILPYDNFRGGPIVLPYRFAEQVSKHIEGGFRQDLIDAVFFPDMGHSHFFIPQGRYDQIYQPLPVSDFKGFYERFFSDSTGKVLYHTAEQLKVRENGQVIDDPRIQHRFKTRNLIGSNDDRLEVTYGKDMQSPANTMHDLPGYHYWGAGFNLSANKNGCFSYQAKGKTFYFDISMYDLDLDPTQPSESEEGF